jgi:type II secretory pathway component PulF
MSKSYRCIVSDRSGVKREQIKYASSAEEAASSFISGDLFLVSITECGEKSLLKKGAYSSKIVREFTDITSMLLESGMDLREALHIETEIVSKGRLSSLIRELISEIDKGDNFSEAISRRKSTFSPLYSGMIRIGEKIGSLETVFHRLSSYLSDRKAFRDKMFGALAYPVLVLAIALIGTALIAFLLMPQIVNLFHELGGTAAKALENRMDIASSMFKTITILSLLVVTGIVGAAIARKQNEPFAAAVDKFLLSLPIAGKLLQSWDTLNFAFAMETLAKGGLPLETALSEAAMAVGNRAYRSAVLTIRESVLKGESLSLAISEQRALPDYLARWISVGERSGKTQTVFEQIRHYYQGEIDRISSRIVVFVEPALIVFVGLIILFLALTFVIPLFSLYGSVI